MHLVLLKGNDFYNKERYSVLIDLKLEDEFNLIIGNSVFKQQNKRHAVGLVWIGMENIITITFLHD